MTKFKRVRTGRMYRYMPVPLDCYDPKSAARPGQRVRVVVRTGCAPPNTWGHAHIEDLEGNFIGLVCVNSLDDCPK